MLELAVPADRGAVNEIALQSHGAHVRWRPDIYCMPEEYYSESECSRLISGRSLYVAKLDSAVVGFTVLTQHRFEGSGIVPRKVMSVDEFAVHETCQGHGIGKAMMEDIHALARAFRCSDLQLKVYPQNDEAVGFYQKCGFQIQNIGMQKKI
jgi:ribosomal protein S18 acetylase RimI-like enzyme